MPITRSAKKALRQSIQRRARNILIKSAYKRAVKTIKKLTEDGKAADAQKNLSTLFKALDKAAKTNVIAKNKASRLKSRLSKLVNKERK